MNASEYEAEYNNRARVREHPALIEGWARDAGAYRDATGARRESIRYGDGDRHGIDLFRPERETSAATVMFIHGGYWQGLHPSSFSHMARGLNARGVVVAIPGYDLCPNVRVGDIVDQLRRACSALADRGPLVVAGHSAGGHLAACLLATEWRALGLPADLVPAAYAISGLFDLKPLVFTTVNDALNLDMEEAERLSPLSWPPPAGKTLDAVAGADESGEYLRQSASIVEAWGRAGVATRYEAIAGANHFTVVAPLADPDSAMTRRVATLAGA